MGRIKDVLSDKVAGLHDRFHPISLHTIDGFANAAKIAEAQTVTLTVRQIHQDVQMIVGPFGSGVVPGTNGALVYGETIGAKKGKRTTLTMFEKNADIPEQAYADKLQDMLPGVPVEFK